LREHFQVYFVNALNRVHPLLPKTAFKEAGTGNFPRKRIETPLLLSDIPRSFKRYGLPEELFVNELKKIPEAPEFIFVTSGMTYWYTGVQYTIRLLKEVFPASKVLLGGIYPALLPEHAEQNSGADIIVPYQKIDSCLDKIEKVTSLPFSRELKPAAYDLLGEYYYAPILTSTGCVFDCSYCVSRKLSQFWQFPVEFAADTILDLTKNYKVKNIAFYDDALLANAESHIDPILERIIQNGIKANFYTPNGLHIRFLELKTALLMKEAGFVDLRLSLESSDRGFQSKHGNKTGNEEFQETMKILYRAGFEKENIRVYTLLNTPDQDNKSVEKSMDFIYKNGAIPMLAFYSPIPHTPDFEKARLITHVDEPLFQNNTVYLYRSGFNMDYLQYLKGLEKRYKNQNSLSKNF
jgi:pyruvate-formate lyase-activating enzyme